VKTWGKTHHRLITDLLITGNLIAQWNIQGLVNTFVMSTGVMSFFLGLIFFIIDTQPFAVWVTILIISLTCNTLIVAAKDVSSSGFLDLEFSLDSQSLSQRIQRFFSTLLVDTGIEKRKKRSRDVMFERQRVVAVMYKLCSDRSFV
jgi:hypothetical protein